MQILLTMYSHVHQVNSSEREQVQPKDKILKYKVKLNSNIKNESKSGKMQ